MAADAVTTVIVLEPDLGRRGRVSSLTNLFSAVRHRVVLDHLEGPLSELADVVLPAATFAESGGTLVNNEGRAQRFFQVFIPTDTSRPSWRWL